MSTTSTNAVPGPAPAPAPTAAAEATLTAAAESRKKAPPSVPPSASLSLLDGRLYDRLANAQTTPSPVLQALQFTENSEQRPKKIGWFKRKFGKPEKAPTNIDLVNQLEHKRHNMRQQLKLFSSEIERHRSEAEKCASEYDDPGAKRALQSMLRLTQSVLVIEDAERRAGNLQQSIYDHATYQALSDLERSAADHLNIMVGESPSMLEHQAQMQVALDAANVESGQIANAALAPDHSVDELLNQLKRGVAAKKVTQALNMPDVSAEISTVAPDDEAVDVGHITLAN